MAYMVQQGSFNPGTYGGVWEWWNPNFQPREGYSYEFGTGEDTQRGTYVGTYNGRIVLSDGWGRLTLGTPTDGPSGAQVLQNPDGSFAPMPEGSRYGDQGILNYWADNPTDGRLSVYDEGGFLRGTPESQNYLSGGYGSGPSPANPFPGMVYDPVKGTYVTDPNATASPNPTRTTAMGGETVTPLEDPNQLIDLSQGEFKPGGVLGATPDISNWQNMTISQIRQSWSPQQMAMLPVEALTQFPNDLLQTVIDANPNILGDIPADRLATFPSEAINLFISNLQQRGDLQSNPKIAQQMQNLQGVLQNAGFNPVSGQPSSGSPSAVPGAYYFNPYEAPTIQGGANPLDIYRNTFNQTPSTAPLGGSRPMGSARLMGGPEEYDPLVDPSTGGYVDPYLGPPVSSPPTTTPTGNEGAPPGPPSPGMQWQRTYEWDPINMEMVWGWRETPLPRPTAGSQPTTAVMIGGDLLQGKAQAEIAAIEAKIQAAMENARLAQEKQDFAQQKFYEQQLQQLQQQAASLRETQRQFDINTQGSAAQRAQQQAQFEATFGLQQAGVTGMYQGSPTLNAQQMAFDQARAQTLDRANAAYQAAQVALAQGNQVEAKRQFDLSHQLRAQAQAFSQNMQTQQFEMQQRRDPASFLDKVFAARGQQAPTGQPGSNYPAPLTAGSILNNEYTPPGIRQVFGGGDRLTGAYSAPTTQNQTTFNPVSAQDWGDFNSLERQATLAAVQSTGQDPADWLKKSQQLSGGTFSQPNYSAPVR